MLPDVLGEFLKISESTPVFPDAEKGYLLHKLSSELPVVLDGKVIILIECIIFKFWNNHQPNISVSNGAVD